jgi:hypothetical protein
VSDFATACLDDAAALHVLSSRFSGPGAGADPGVSAVPADLLDHLIQIPDWRVQKWVEHPLAAVLALRGAGCDWDAWLHRDRGLGT